MITFSQFGKHGNLGNQLHQLATLIGFCEKYNCEMVLPPWKYARYFAEPVPEGNVKCDLMVEESAYHYNPDYWHKFALNFKRDTVDILGWLQSEKYWEHCKQAVIDQLTFRKDFIEETVAKLPAKLFDKEIIAISVRRGDFVRNPNFYLLPLQYYLYALLEFFPKYKKYNVLFFSDDLKYCKENVWPRSNFYFADNLTNIEQLCAMHLCNHFIISNSTFSWWGARLGEKPGTKIIRSPYQLSGEMALQLNTKDYYPERWEIYDHTKKKKKIGGLIRGGFVKKAVILLKGESYFEKKAIKASKELFIKVSAFISNKWVNNQ
ncbi:MAG: alpha-1,2-fucosyltransferase [Ilyomonas sp.]